MYVCVCVCVCVCRCIKLLTTRRLSALQRSQKTQLLEMYTGVAMGWRVLHLPIACDVTHTQLTPVTLVYLHAHTHTHTHTHTQLTPVTLVYLHAHTHIHTQTHTDTENTDTHTDTLTYTLTQLAPVTSVYTHTHSSRLIHQRLLWLCCRSY